MTDIPILMSGPMVQAILREIRAPGTGKTMTRRLAERFVPAKHPPAGMEGKVGEYRPTRWVKVQPGDRLWVRETWGHTGSGIWTVQSAMNAYGGNVVYRADDDGALTGWFPSIHMPKLFSRLTLLVTATRTEQLQDINEEDARAEGMERPILPHWPGHPFGSAFRGTWQSLHDKPGHRWDDNPQVAAVSFRPVLANIDALKADTLSNATRRTLADGRTGTPAA